MKRSIAAKRSSCTSGSTRSSATRGGQPRTQTIVAEPEDANEESPLSEPGFRFRHELRVRYVETDAQAVVYHSNYLVYCDAARVEWFRALAGGGTPWREDRDYDVVLAHASLDFKASAQLRRSADDLDAPRRTSAPRASPSSIASSASGTLLCEAKTVHVADRSRARTKRAAARRVQGAARLVAYLNDGSRSG